LINGKSAYSWLINNTEGINGEISICSAFLRSSIIKDLSIKFKSQSTVRVMVRWQLGDLLAGASDLESYKICVELGWKFFVCLNFHGKVFHLPPHGILVGSANATESGFGLLSNSNSEACTIVSESGSNIEFVNNLFGSAFEMNDELFAKMQDVFNQSTSDSIFHDWPVQILQQLLFVKEQTSKVFLSECFITSGQELLSFPAVFSIDAQSDLSLLGLSGHLLNVDAIARQFKKTKIFSLLERLLQMRGGEIYFGTLTSALHDWLIEDPAPHRREVKNLVKNLYTWIEGLGEDATGLTVDRPNHSERIRLIKY
jgi:hypothetical protein